MGKEMGENIRKKSSRLFLYLPLKTPKKPQ
jgi:hypothetical protein